MRRSIVSLMSLVMLTTTAFAWNAHGHRTITYLALDGLPSTAPEWLRDSNTRHRIAYEASEPDRWRGVKSTALGHENNPDHFMDVEELEQFGLTLETVAPLRYDFVRDMAIARQMHPENFEAYDPSKDPEHTKIWPGFVLHAIAEHYGKLRSSFNTLRILEIVNEPARAAQLQEARENVIHEMGMLSHFVGDAAQPLHTTVHHHGWVGPNPNDYTTEKSFHAYIDGTVLDLHKLTFATLRPQVHFDTKIDTNDPWKDCVAYLRTTHEAVEPLYAMQKSGELQKEAGKQFITERLAAGASMLEAMYWGAWETSAPTDEQVVNFVKYDDFKVELLP